ncbi:MAG TPA: DUF1653 domain-containing protein [Candidatus Paceibacterota bacterium]|nr:DUF1653 domain-containing protein [Candidatus Paceibacterota bacterium]
MEEIRLNHVYEHHKGGKYLVFGVAEESTNARKGNKVVLYVSLTYGKMKCRDLEEFTEVVEWPDGQRRSRFIPTE